MSVTFWEDTWRTALAEKAAAPDADLWTNDIDRRKVRFLRGYAPQRGVAVEVGCGSARLLARLGQQTPGLRLIAVDESLAALELARSTAEAFAVEMETLVASAGALPLESESVDLVLSGGLLEHFPDPLPILREMVRVLRPGGVFYADVVPRKCSWYRRAEAERMRQSEWLAPGVYESSLAAGDYRRLLAECGCRDIVTLDCGFYPGGIQKLWGRRRRLATWIAERLDGTPLAARWGWYFMVVGRKG